MKVNYGIYLGTTSASIARIEEGMPVILKSNVQKDHIPLCIYFTKKGILVGDAAYNYHKIEKLKVMKSWDTSDSNSFVEFTRTLGTDKIYYSSNANKSFTSTELVSEIFKELRSFVTNENVKSAVVTVPAHYNINQIDATKKAAELAGLEYVQLVLEPYAAAIAYADESRNKNGYWLVFGFGGGTFDSALIKMEDGIMKVLDTDRDNFLGGKNLDFAIIDEIIIPHIEENFAIDSILKDVNKKRILRNNLKYYAEETKVKLSYNNTYNLFLESGDLSGEDDDGDEIELDITVTQDDITRALAPVFQKAIDISNQLLKRNNLNGNDLDSLVLVGGDTLSPVLREMLEKQICKPDTSIDPKTTIVLGAALYASTVDVLERSKRTSLDINTIEDLLFELTEDEKITSSEFEKFFEQLSELKEVMDIDTLSIIYSKLKEYGRKA